MSESAGPSQPPDSHGNQIDPSPATLGAIVQSGIPQSFGLISVDGKNPWILDSGATENFFANSLLLASARKYAEYLRSFLLFLDKCASNSWSLSLWSSGGSSFHMDGPTDKSPGPFFGPADCGPWTFLWHCGRRT